jgi:hypothetical protein
MGRKRDLLKEAAGVRLWVLTLLVVFCLSGLGASVLAQPGCRDQCYVTLNQCLQAAMGDPMQEAVCEDNYDACAEACIFP